MRSDCSGSPHQQSTRLTLAERETTQRYPSNVGGDPPPELRSLPACRPLGQLRWLPLDILTPARLRDVEFVRNGWEVFESASGLVVRTPDGLMLELTEGGPEAA